MSTSAGTSYGHCYKSLVGTGSRAQDLEFDDEMSFWIPLKVAGLNFLSLHLATPLFVKSTFEMKDVIESLPGIIFCLVYSKSFRQYLHI